MNREISAYLDCARLLGALLVLLAHAELNWVPDSGNYLIPFGNESLAILFLISGFVIGFASHKREPTIKDYLMHRVARAYSLLVPCVIVGLLLDFTGQHFMAHYYHVQSWPPLGSKLQEVVAGFFSLTFLGEAWGGDAYPGSMAPYWTLPYEMTYYLLFGAVWYLRSWRRLLMLCVVGGIAGPQIVMFFPLWLLGMATYWCNLRIKLSVATGRWIFFAVALVILAVEILIVHYKLTFGFGAQESPELWPFYLSGLLFAILTVGFYFSGFAISRYTGWVKWMAGAAGTLYLLHFPLGRLLNGLVPWSWSPLLRWPAIILPLIIIALIVAQYGERRKDIWRRYIEAGVDWIGVVFLQRKLALQKDV